MDITDIIRIARASEKALRTIADSEAWAAHEGKLKALAAGVRVFGDQLSIDTGGFDAGEAGTVAAALAVDPDTASRDDLIKAIETIGGKKLRANVLTQAKEDNLRGKLKKMQADAKKPEQLRVVRVEADRPSGELASGFRPPGLDTTPFAGHLAKKLRMFFDGNASHAKVVGHFHAMGCDRRCERPGGACPEIRVCTNLFDPAFDPEKPDPEHFGEEATNS